MKLDFYILATFYVHTLFRFRSFFDFLAYFFAVAYATPDEPSVIRIIYSLALHFPCLYV